MDVVGSGDATMRAVEFADGGAAARLATVTTVLLKVYSIVVYYILLFLF